VLVVWCGVGVVVVWCKNYLQAAAYRVSDLIKMPAEMTKLKLKFQTTDANSFNLPGHTSLDDEPMNVDPADTFEETSNMKKNAPEGQGTDAALEQIIKRSKKGVKIKVGVFFNLDLDGTRSSGQCQETSWSRRNWKGTQVWLEIHGLT
jgi:hypothetical protein